jgi:hypothetical protein
VAAAQETKDRARYGHLVREITTETFGVKGTFYIVDNSKLIIRRFSYDNAGDHALFTIKNKGSEKNKIIHYAEGANEQ